MWKYKKQYEKIFVIQLLTKILYQFCHFNDKWKRTITARAVRWSLSQSVSQDKDFYMYRLKIGEGARAEQRASFFVVAEQRKNFAAPKPWLHTIFHGFIVLIQVKNFLVQIFFQTS